MIISIWALYLLARKASRQSPASGDYSDNEEVNETQLIAVLEHWLRKTENEAAKLFRQKSENKTESNNLLLLGEEVRTVRSESDIWDPFEERRSAKSQPNGTFSRTNLASSSSHDLMEDRTRIQLMRWSHTRVYRVSSEIRKDAMQERVQKVRNSITRVMYHAESDSDVDFSN